MSNDGEEMENEKASGEDQSEEASRSSRRSSRSKTQADSAEKKSRSQKRKAAREEKMRKVVNSTMQTRIMREAPEHGPFQSRRESGGSSRSSKSKSARSTPQFSKPNRSSEDEKSDGNLSETNFSVASENASSVSVFSKSTNEPLEIVRDGEQDEDAEIPVLSEEEEDENGPDFLERLEKDIESGCSFRRIKIQTEFLDSERAEIKKSQWRWRMTNEKMFLRHFGQLRDITWLADQQDFVLQEMKTAEINEKMGLSELEFDRMSKLESMLKKSRKRSSSVKELGNRERLDQVRKDVEQGIELESEINAHRISKEDEDNFIQIAKLDCKTKKGAHHF